MKNKVIYFGIIIIFLAAIGFFINKKFFQSDFATVRLGDKIFLTEVATNPKERGKGLSGRAELCGNCAMLFLFENKERRDFWMKDMKFAIDIIWINDNEIVNISPRIPHEKGEAEIINSSVPVDKVLEINAGESEKLELRIGDKIEMD